jgi:aminopeptidase YwaD
MSQNDLTTKARTYLRQLCVDIPNRRLGTPGNRAATTWFADAIGALGLSTQTLEFDCLDWVGEGAGMRVNGQDFDVRGSPYALGCRVTAPLLVVTSLEELAAAESGGKILLVRGELARESLMPKNFPFYNPEEHQRIVALLEAKAPLAVVAATAWNPDLAGAVYPCPLIQDGDFLVPAAHLTVEEGARLAELDGETADLEIRSRREPARGCNVIARLGPEAGRQVVVCAHIDTADGTPGALDNGAGVVTLLLLAELLREYDGRLGVEIVVLNGEDHYSAAGEIDYLARNQQRLPDTMLAVNLDAAGYVQGSMAYSLHGCPEELAAAIRRVFAGHPGLQEGEPWYQSDHMVFAQNGVPAMAVTSERVGEVLNLIAHTERDTPDQVDPERLVVLAMALRDLVVELERLPVGVR